MNSNYAKRQPRRYLHQNMAFASVAYCVRKLEKRATGWYSPTARVMPRRRDTRPRVLFQGRSAQTFWPIFKTCRPPGLGVSRVVSPAGPTLEDPEDLPWRAQRTYPGGPRGPTLESLPWGFVSRVGLPELAQPSPYNNARKTVAPLFGLYHRAEKQPSGRAYPVVKRGALRARRGTVPAPKTPRASP